MFDKQITNKNYLIVTNNRFETHKEVSKMKVNQIPQTDSPRYTYTLKFIFFPFGI